ncbi:MAG TPA: serine hydrolase [Flavilitoribacter sp.]|nr:serine hydrolase [Flavilitoribacter sp.]HMQ87284.1 serine hydrolase [Flavilitoribacter sp.]
MPTRLITFLFLFIAFRLPAQVDAAALDAYFEKSVKDWGIPGMAVGIIKDGKVVLSKGYGVRELGKKDAIDGNTLFAIASNTKAFISASMVMLQEDGKLNLDDPVRKYLPYFTLYDEYASEHATVRDLLCHRLGLGTFSGDVVWFKSNYPAEEVVRRVRYLPQAYEFRSGYGYSNVMFITAGEVIRSAYGKPWSAFVKEKILTPLGMDRTRTSVTELAGMDNVATPHKTRGNTHTPIAYVNWDNMGAAGGILSSTNDMLKWLSLQLDEGQYQGTTLFKPSSQTEFWTPHNNYKVSKASRDFLPSRHFNGYGLGWGLFDYGGSMVASHSGGYDGMYSRVVAVPDQKLGIVVLTNSMTGISSAVMYHVLDQYLNIKPDRDWSDFYLDQQRKGAEAWAKREQGRKDARVTGTKPSFSLEKYAGLYHDDLFGDIEIRYDGGRLSLHFPSSPALDAALDHWHYDTFEIKWNENHAWFDFGTLQFTMDNNAGITGLRFDVPNDDIFFDEIHALRVDR